MQIKAVTQHFLLNRHLPPSPTFSSLGRMLFLISLVGTLTACEVSVPAVTVQATPDSAKNSLEVNDTTTTTNDKAALAIDINRPTEYQLDDLRVDKAPYIDRDYRFTAVPDAYDGLCYIRTANDDKYQSDPEFLALTTNKPVTVYVGIDSRITTLPSWLESWTATGDHLSAVTVEPRTFQLYSRDFAAGEVVLGAHQMGYNMYVVLIQDQEPGQFSSCGTPSTATLSYSWEPNPDYVTGYKIYYGNTESSVNKLVSDLAVTTQGLDPSAPSVEYHAEELGLYAGQTACFSVSAYDDIGDSSPSSPICITL